MRQLCLFFFLAFTYTYAAQQDPFKKITVTSKTATFQKESKDSSLFRLCYNDDVHVTFADATTITADELAILVETKNLKKQDKKKKDVIAGSGIKQILFTKNVCVQRVNQTVWADNVTLFLCDKTCKLSGHVKIEQRKASPKDIPVKTECEEALLAWDSQEVTLLGSQLKPVSTTIELAGLLDVTKKRKKHEHHKNSPSRRSEKSRSG